MRAGLWAFLAAFALAAGCGPTVTVRHKVDPIYVTVDVNIKVQKELEDVFDFEKARGKPASPPVGNEERAG